MYHFGLAGGRSKGCSEIEDWSLLGVDVGNSLLVQLPISTSPNRTQDTRPPTVEE